MKQDALAAILDREYGAELGPVLHALAAIESDFDAGAIGDNGSSFGLWQIHRPAWPALPWPMPADPAAQARFIRPVVTAMVAGGGLSDPPTWWRHGGLVPGLPDPIDLIRWRRYASALKDAAWYFRSGVGIGLGVAGVAIMFAVLLFLSRRR